MDRVRIKVRITRSLEFRAKIEPVDSVAYEVTVGGKAWLGGKGREFETEVLRRCSVILSSLKRKLKDHKHIPDMGLPPR